MVKKRSGKGVLVKAFAEEISANLLEHHKDTVKEVIGRKSGLYVLMKNATPYYVGLASKLPSRIGRHLKDRHAGKWDKFNFYSIGKQKYLKDVETILIRVANPPGNKQKGSFGKHRNLRNTLKNEIIQSIKGDF